MATALIVPVAGAAVAAWFLPTPAAAAVMAVSVAGDHVTVVFDPRGVANPHDDDFVGLGLPLAAGTLALLATAVVLGVPATAKH